MCIWTGTGWASLGCCSGKACCDNCCGAFKACGVPAKNFPKITYVISGMVLMVISVIMMYSLRFATDSWDWLSCHRIAGGGSVCFGLTSVFRASFTLTAYHIIILITLFPRATCSQYLHDGCWGGKNLLIFIGFIASFWLPYEFYGAWAWISLVVSTLFLFIQGYFLLNLAYTWNDTLVGNS